ncbi:MAG: restriction endonuclease, partial [Candidatus Aminicenantes bacterium]|nr:restriction endonuclease [Candidatus Aminicenantes bacterium]
ILDEVFGYNNFRNEIIWCYKRWPSKQKNFQSMHDVILRYSKSTNVVWNQLYDDFTEQTSKRIKGGKKIEHYEGESGKILIRATKETSPGVAMCDYWNIPMIAGQAKERLGYPTQKPEALLERIITASSNKNDLILDPFCGCGTAMAVAHRLKRRWIGIDISPTAISLIEKRLEKLGAIKGKDYDSIGMPTTISALKKLEPFEFQNWVINEMQAKQSKRVVGDKGIDGHMEKSLYSEEAGIQVKQSEKVGRNVVDNFETALERKKYKRGYVIGFSFTRGSHEEVARVKEEKGLYIKLIKVEDLLKRRPGLLK